MKTATIEGNNQAAKERLSQKRRVMVKHKAHSLTQVVAKKSQVQLVQLRFTIQIIHTARTLLVI